MALIDMLAPGKPPPMVTVPRFSISAGEAGGGAGGLLDAVGLGGAAPDPWLRSVAAIMVVQQLAPAVSWSAVKLVADQQAPAAAVGDDWQIGLGYGDQSEPVFSGQLDSVVQSIGGHKTLYAVNAASALARTRVNQSYEQQSAGAIVRDICSQSGVQSGAISDGTEFPFYVIDDRKNAYQHIADLALLCGYIAYCDTGNNLCFGPVEEGDPAHRASYRNDIVELQVDNATSATGKVAVTGEGAAGANGKDAAFWLLKDSSAVSAEQGDGGARLSRSAPVLSDANAVATAAAGLQQQIALRRARGRLTLPGNAAISCATVIELSDLPDASLNGRCLVSAVRHRYDKRHGFVSECDFYLSAGGFALSLPGIGDLL